MLLCANFGQDTSNISSDIVGNHLPYVVALNDVCDLENKVNVTRFEPGLRFDLVLICTKFGEDTSNIS